MRAYLTEFIGTFFLVLTVGLSVISGTNLAPLAIGASLMVMVYMGGHISGAHYNPAVSLAVMLRGKFLAKEFVNYVIAQLCGAVAAAAAVLAITHQSFAPSPVTGNLTGAFLVESLYTFALALVVLNVATAKKTEGNSFYGLAIGFTITVAAFAGGPISGGAFNPAVGFGPILIDTLHGGRSMHYLWLYIVGPLLGGGLAGLIFRYQNGPAELSVSRREFASRELDQMTETLKCPECSAPLDYPANGGPAVKCSFCGSTVLLPGAGRSSVDAGSADFAAGLGPLVSKALEMAQMSNHVRAGNKIEAIRIYRNSFGVDLLTAKNAIDSLSAGRPILLNNANSGGAARGPSLQYAPVASGKRNSPAILIVILVFVGLGLAVLLLGLMRGQATAVTSAPAMTVVTIPALPVPSNFIPPAPAEPPSFAAMVMQFGSDGIGPGQFKDHRTIALDGHDHVYVGEYSNGRVQVFDTKGTFLKAWSINDVTQNRSLLALAASRGGTVYACTPGHIFCFEGITGRNFGEAGTRHDDSELHYMDCFAAPSGDIFSISDERNIVILDSEGQIKSVIDVAAKVGEDLHLRRVIVNGTGDMYALDASKGIFRFAPDGRYINRFGGGDDDAPAFSLAADQLALDGKGRIYLSGVNPAVRVFSGDGRYIDGFGKNQVAFGLAIDDQDNIYACFRNDHQVRKFTINPTAGK